MTFLESPIVYVCLTELLANDHAAQSLLNIKTKILPGATNLWTSWKQLHIRLRHIANCCRIYNTSTIFYKFLQWRYEGSTSAHHGLGGSHSPDHPVSSNGALGAVGEGTWSWPPVDPLQNVAPVKVFQLEMVVVDITVHYPAEFIKIHWIRSKKCNNDGTIWNIQKNGQPVRGPLLLGGAVFREWVM